MSTIYFAKALPTGSKAKSSVYADRGLDLIWGTILDAGVIAVPTHHQLDYGIYRDNISAWMKATALGEIVMTDSEDHSISFVSLDNCLPLRFPTLAFGFSKPISSIEEERIAREYDVVTDGNGKNKIYYAKSPSRETVQAIARLPNVMTNSKSGRTSANLDDLRAFGLANKILTAFLATHTYPSSAALPVVTSPSGISLLTTQTELMTIEEFEEVFPSDAKRARTNLLDTVLSPRALKGDLNEESRERMRKLVAKSGPSSTRAVAKPSGWHPEVQFGPANKCPARPGLVFHYFPNCIDGDTRLLTKLLSQPRFLRLFGEDRDEIMTKFGQFKSGVQAWANTDMGKIMQHMVQGMMFAIDAQAQLYILLEDNGDYHGFVLLGSEFRVLAQDTWFYPVEHSEILKALADLPTHAASIHALCRLLTATRLVDGDHEAVEADEITTARELYLHLQKRKWDDEAQTTLVRLVGRLSFRVKYDPINVTTLVDTLSLAFSPSTPIPDTLPMYLGAYGVQSPSRLYEVLSRYGPTAPSFLTNSGTRFIVPTKESKDAHSEIDVETRKRNLEVITVYPKELSTAVSDWKETIEGHYIQTNQGEVAKGSRGVTFVRKDRDILWDGLRTWVGKVVLDRSARPRASTSGGVAKPTKNTSAADFE